MHPISKTRSTPQQRQSPDPVDAGLTFTGKPVEYRPAGKLESNTKPSAKRGDEGTK
jgi:hypothetical protein